MNKLRGLKRLLSLLLVLSLVWGSLGTPSRAVNAADNKTIHVAAFPATVPALLFTLHTLAGNIPEGDQVLITETRNQIQRSAAPQSWTFAEDFDGLADLLALAVSQNPQARFVIYVDDYQMKDALPKLLPKLKDAIAGDRVAYRFITDGGGVSYNTLTEGYKGRNSTNWESRHNEYKAFWEDARNKMANGETLSSAEENDLYKTAWAATAVESDAQWWWIRKADDTINNVIAAVEEAIINDPKVTSNYMNGLLDKVVAAGNGDRLRAMYQMDDSAINNARANNKIPMLVLGTGVGVETEDPVGKYFPLLKELYGDSYELIYKPHPGNVKDQYDLPAIYPDRAVKTPAVIPAEIPAELIAFYNPDVIMSGYPTTTFQTLDDAHSAALIHLTKNAAYNSTDRLWTVVKQYADKMDFFISPVKSIQVSPDIDTDGATNILLVEVQEGAARYWDVDKNRWLGEGALPAPEAVRATINPFGQVCDFCEMMGDGEPLFKTPKNYKYGDEMVDWDSLDSWYFGEFYDYSPEGAVYYDKPVVVKWELSDKAKAALGGESIKLMSGEYVLATLDAAHPVLEVSYGKDTPVSMVDGYGTKSVLTEYEIYAHLDRYPNVPYKTNLHADLNAEMWRQKGYEAYATTTMDVVFKGQRIGTMGPFEQGYDYYGSQPQITGTATTFFNPRCRTLSIKGKKVAEGFELKGGDFTFQVYRQAWVDQEYKTIVLAEVTNDKDGNFELLWGALTNTGYYWDDTEEIYIREVTPEDKPGWTFDKSFFTIQIKEGQEGSGNNITYPLHLVSVKGYVDMFSTDPVSEDIVFVNTLAVTGSATLKAVKQMEGRQLKDQEFTFRLMDAAGTTLQTVKNDKDGKVAFEPIVFTQDDAGKSFTYRIAEVAGADTAVYYDAHEEEVTVTVTDKGDGTLACTVAYDQNGAVFVNEKNIRDISVRKHWADGDDQDKIRPKSVVVKLLADGQDSGKTLVLDESNKWEDSFKDLTVRTGERYIVYTVEEVKTDVVSGKDAEGSYAIAISGNVTDGFVISNTHTPLFHEVEVSKKAINGTEELEGALLSISSTVEGFKTISWTSGKESKKVSLKAGSYTLTEVTAPEGYAKAESILFTVTEEGKVLIDGQEQSGNLVLMEDDYTRVTIKKTDITGTKEIGGAVLQVKDGDKLIEEWTSEEGKSHEIVNKLIAGKTYTLVEIAAPDGYLVAEAIEFTVNTDGKVQTVEMKDDHTKVTIKKTDITGTKEIGGAVLQVKDGETVVEEWTSVEGKSHEINAKLVAGKEYTLVEITAPDGYLVAEEVKFTVNTDGKVQTVEMKDDHTKVTIKKTDITGTKEIGGAVLQVKDGDKIVEEWTSEEGKSHEINAKLVAGKEYTLVEITAPDGYLVAEEVKFTVNTDGKVQTVEMKDDHTKVTIKKTDITGTKEIGGAVLQVKDGETVVEEWTSVEGKSHEINAKLAAGKEYTLVEITAPDGYLVAEEVKFSVNTDGKVQTVEMKDEMTHMEVSKVDIVSAKELPGATIRILDEEGQTVEEWISEEEAHGIEGLKIGVEYTLIEVEAPAGYQQITTEIKFMLDKEGLPQLLTAKVEPAGAAEVIDGVLVLKNQEEEEPEESIPEDEMGSVEPSTEPETDDVKDTTAVPSEAETTPEIPTEPVAPTEPSYTVPTVTTVPTAPESGDHSVVLPYLVMMGVAAAGTVLLLTRKRKEEEA